jgi:hypothetical protein
MNKSPVVFNTDATIHQTDRLLSFCNACVKGYPKEHCNAGKLHAERAIQNHRLLDRRCNGCGYTDTIKEDGQK